MTLDQIVKKEFNRDTISHYHDIYSSPGLQKSYVVNNVLEDFKEDEEERIKEITENIVKLIPTLIDKKIDLFSSKVNQSLNGI